MRSDVATQDRATAAAKGRDAVAMVRSVIVNAPLLVYELYNVVLRLVLPRRAVFEPSTLPAVADLAAHTSAIRSELDELLQQGRVRSTTEIDPGQARIAGADEWKLFIFRIFGIDVPENQARCPETWSHLMEVPGLVTAMFSVMEPHTRLQPHTGLLKGLLRAHLGLVVPAQGARFELDGATYTWSEGSVLVFDECYRHSAVNDSDERRVVLLLDVVRPMRWPWLDRLNRWVVGTVSRSRRFQASTRRSVIEY